MHDVNWFDDKEHTGFLEVDIYALEMRVRFLSAVDSEQPTVIKEVIIKNASSRVEEECSSHIGGGGSGERAEVLSGGGGGGGSL